MLLLQVLTFWVTLTSSYGLIYLYPNNSIAKHYCGSSLSGALFSACKKSGFVAHFSPRSEFNRSTRGIIDECCMNPCSNDQLIQYCQKKFARISISKKRKRSQHFIETNKVSKSKRSPTCTCRSRVNSARFSKKTKRNNNRITKAHQRKKQLMRSSTANPNMGTSSTESQVVAEAQYIDDWTGDEDGLFFITPR
ncbi:insulin-like growth factor I [Daphnia pulex]|uniref:insulin-like growth factor I n=1 Tax=Daphnia pulex TaxID=6669 RepID=UPI001EDEC9E0|nr:insulin-like growth factor I [Daphnia pulex]